MSYKDLLVHLDDGPGCTARVAAAIMLAGQHDAHLTGVYPVLEMAPKSFIETQIPDTTRAILEAESRDRAEAALAAFRDAAGRAGIAHEARTLRVPDAAPAQGLALHAHFADLIVLGPGVPGEAGRLPWRMPEEVVLEAGRPALVVPESGAFETLGERVVVAWDASRAAARAVGDAMPILERARSVLVVSVDPRTTPLAEGEREGLDIAAYLGRHGIEVEVQAIETDRMSAGEVLLSFATDGGRDLLVMGAYGHPRLRELVLGGVTRTVLDRMTLPALMAH
jgi:nucleotide-binding universal stress UspA family protein